MSLVEERDKYIRAYKLSNYRMGDQRWNAAKADVEWAEKHGCQSLLDVGCGRGEIVNLACQFGMYGAGTEIVPTLTNAKNIVECDSTNLSRFFDSRSFDAVTCFDVLEHIPAGDDIKSLLLFAEIANRCVIVTANNKPSHNGDDDLHINIRPYDEWDHLIRECLSGFSVYHIKNTYSPTWRALRN